MINLLIIADVEGWAYDRRAKAIKKYAPDDFSVDIEYASFLHSKDLSKYQVVFNIEYAMSLLVRQVMRNTGFKGVMVNSHNADHQRNEKFFHLSKDTADFIILNNREAYCHFGEQQGTCNISNGVDFDHFGVDKPLTDRGDVALWTGSHQKGLKDFLLPLKERTKICELDLHPVDGKGWDADKSVQEDIVWPTERMRRWYNKAKIVLCCSTSDATPNYLLEGMACGLVPVTTRVGNAMEFGVDRENCVFTDRTLDGFHDAIEYALDNYERLAAAAIETISTWGWENRSKLFYDLFRKLHQGQKVEPFSYAEFE